MPDQVKFTKKEFLRRERDIMDKYRVPQDIERDMQELQALGVPQLEQPAMQA